MRPARLISPSVTVTMADESRVMCFYDMNFYDMNFGLLQLGYFKFNRTK